MTTADLILCELAATSLTSHESYSPFCLKVHRALQLCGLPYQRRHAGRPDAFASYNPAKQVPVLLVDGQPVADSTRILTRLDQLSNGVLTRGLDERARAEAWLWEELADSVLNGFLVAARWHDEDNWPRTKSAYFSEMPAPVRAIVPGILRAKVSKALSARDVIRSGAESCWAQFEETLDRLEQRAPERGFWLGAVPSRADIALHAQLFSLQTPLTPRQGARVAQRPTLTAWLRRVEESCARAKSTPASALARDGGSPGVSYVS